MKNRLTPRDAIHAANAIENKIPTIVSYDKDFDSLDTIKSRTLTFMCAETLPPMWI